MFSSASLLLVAITDTQTEDPAALIQRAEAAVRGGATMIQLRLKGADSRVQVELARALVAALPVPVIVNDRADVALAAGAAGVHVGADDLPVVAIRRFAPTGFIVGASVGSDAEVGGASGADYVGIGPVFGTPTKADAGPAIGVAEAVRLARRCALPAVAIGGVTPENASLLLGAGMSGIAVVSSVFRAPDPEAAARALRSASGR
ncbi:MAG: thiamine phosphate synthase [Gemmatimonadaceae bacterium]